MSEREYGAGLKAWRAVHARMDDAMVFGSGGEHDAIEAALVREAEVDRDLSDERLASASVDVHPAVDVPGDWIARFTSNDYVTQGRSRSDAILMLLDSARMVLEHQAVQIPAMVASAYVAAAAKASDLPEIQGLSNADLRKRIRMTITAMTPPDAHKVLEAMLEKAREEGRLEVRRIRRTLWAVWCAGEGWCPSHGAVESFERHLKAEEAAARWRAEMPSCTYEVRVFMQGDELPRRKCVDE